MNSHLVLLLAALSGCVSMGPTDWRADQHVMVMRQCRVACHPGRMAVYESMDGSCACAERKPFK